jgi:hypothetical protein
MPETNELDVQAQVKVEDASVNLLAAAQTDGPQSDKAQTPVTNGCASVDGSVSASVSSSHDLEAFIFGGILGWGVYRENKKELDPVIDACERFSMEVNMLPIRSMQRMSENTVNKPLTTALEFLACPVLPALHASLSVINDRLKA